MWNSLRTLAVGSLATMSGSIPTAPTSSVAPTIGQDADSALARIQAAHALDPDDPVPLEQLATSYGQKGDLDSQIAYLSSALAALDSLEVDDAKQKSADIKRLTAALSKLDSASSALKAARDEYLKKLSEALMLYSHNKRDRNVLDVAGRIFTYQPTHSLATQYVKDVLARTGDDFRPEAMRLLGTRDLHRPRAFLADWAKVHSSWDSADALETDGYSIRTDIGYDTLHFAALALEHLAVYYRSFYDVQTKLQEGKTRVHLCRTREEFEALGAQAKTMDVTNASLKGFLHTVSSTVSYDNGPMQLQSMAFDLYSYDPRDEGQPLSNLYGTLSHEASHQYMHLSTGVFHPPPWLDEGMATFFEGAVIRSNGEVLVGLPPHDRLIGLKDTLRHEPEALAEALESTDGLAAELYPVAWGLVYFLDQYRLEDGSRPYRAHLKDAIGIVRTGEMPGRVFERAVLAKHDMSFAAFEKMWIETMRAWIDLELDPEKAAAHHLELGARFLAAGAADPARECFERVLIYQPKSAPALLGLTEIYRRVLAKSKGKNIDRDKDVATLWVRRAFRASTLSGDARNEKAAAEIWKQIDPGGFDIIAKSESQYRKEVQKQIARHMGSGHPKAALALANQWLDRVLGDDSSAGVLAEIRKAGPFELDRTYSPFDGTTFTAIACSPKQFHIEQGEIACQVERPARAALFIEPEIAPRFRLEGDFQLADANCTASLLVELPWKKLVQGFTLRPLAPAEHEHLEHMYVPFDTIGYGAVAKLGQGQTKYGNIDFVFENPKLAKTEIQPGQWVHFALEREPLDTLKLSLDGKEIARRALDPQSTEVRVGVLFFGGAARLRGLRIVERDKL